MDTLTQKEKKSITKVILLVNKNSKISQSLE